MSPVKRTRRRSRPWWLETAIVVAVYQIYSWLRIEARGGVTESLDNAHELIDLERALGIFHEETVQEIFLGWEAFIRFWNVFHGLVHFVAPPLVLIFLWRRDRPRYRYWRNVYGGVLVLGLIGFAVYPVTPPRLLDPSFGFVDTGETIGGIGFMGESQPIDVGNAFAEIPSLHVAFSTAALWAMYPYLRRWWTRAAMLAYPVAMTFSTIVTGKHYFLDAVAGALVVLMAVGAERLRGALRRREADVGVHGPVV